MLFDYIPPSLLEREALERGSRQLGLFQLSALIMLMLGAALAHSAPADPDPPPPRLAVYAPAF